MVIQLPLGVQGSRGALLMEEVCLVSVLLSLFKISGPPLSLLCALVDQMGALQGAPAA